MSPVRQPRSISSLALLPVLGLVVFFLGCVPDRRHPEADDDDDGGSGSSDDDDAASDPDVPDTEFCDPVSGWPADWADKEWVVLELTNQLRAAGATCGGEVYPPVPPLVMEEHLRCSSRLHSVDMVERNFLDHTNPDGDGPGERMSAAGYNWMGFGENIGWGYLEPEEMVQGWIDSPPHCSNLMTDWFTELGVGYYEGDGQVTWTQNFGSR
ncbi:MAG: CAP domain-containing protein [Myxococcota bacterium]|nr:CAP domain-containing protein [Myxococcota bacterium]